MKSPSLRVALFLAGYLLILLATSFPKGMAPPHLRDLVWGVLASLAILGLTRLFLARDRRSWSDIGFDADGRSAARLVAGLAIGAGVYGVTYLLISILLGPVRLVAGPPVTPGTWALTIASFLALSCMEELGFRGYPLRSLVHALGVWRAQIVIAVAFGLSHIAFGWSWMNVLMGVIPSALLFGVVAVRSGGLAMPIGVHAALNLMQWVVGAKATPGVWTLDADPAITGRLTSYAPLVATAVTLLAAAAIQFWPTRKAETSARVM